MKKIISLVLVLVMVLAFAGCGQHTEHEIKITISSDPGLGDTEVVLKPIEVKEENVYKPTVLTPGIPVEMNVEKG